MFKILKRNEIDTQKWDKCVNQNSSIPTIYANSWYLDIVSPNWKAAIWGDYETVFPLTIKYKYLFLPLLLQPVFSQQLGFFGDILTEKETFIFLNFLKRKFIHINIIKQFSRLNDLSLHFMIGIGEPSWTRTTGALVCAFSETAR